MWLPHRLIHPILLSFLHTCVQACSHSLQSFLCRGQQAPPWGLTVTSSLSLRPEPCRPISFVDLMQPQGLMPVATAVDPVGVPWQPWLQTGTHKLPTVNRVQTLKGLARDLRRPRCRVAKASFASMLFHGSLHNGISYPIYSSLPAHRELSS